jgi:S1-C subfamily serine protease
MRLRLFLALACVVAVQAAATPPAVAEEGFFTDDRPPAVEKVWPSVFAFLCEGRKGANTATAFFVGSKPHPERADRAEYYFLTAGHAVDICEGKRRTLVQDLGGRQFEADGITVARPPERLGNVRVVYVDDTYDIAVVRARPSTHLRIGAPIPVDGACDRALHRRVFSIGFPGVGKRRSLRLAGEVKRWSQGTYVGLGRADFRGVEAIYIAATVDSLPGSSGGPAVDENGALVGVVAKGASGEDNGFRYDVDPAKEADWQTFLVPCQAVLAILKRAGLP